MGPFEQISYDCTNRSRFAWSLSRWFVLHFSADFGSECEQRHRKSPNDDLRLSPALYQLPIALGAAATRYIRSGAAKLVEKMFLSGMLNIDMTMRCAA